MDNTRIEEIENKIDKMLKMINMVEKAVEVGTEWIQNRYIQIYLT